MTVDEARGDDSRQEFPEAAKGFSVFGLGTVVVDHQVVLEDLPEADTKGEVITDRYQVGGPVPTALTLLRRLGMEATFLGQWADDPFGRMIEDDLMEHGVRFEPPRRSVAPRTGFAHVWVERETGRRSVAAYRGSHPVEPHHVGTEEISRHHALHLDGWSTPAALEAARAMQEAGGTVFLDLGSPKPNLEELLEHVDFVNCPSRLVARLFGIKDLEAGARRILELGPAEVTVTSGEEGALYVTTEETLHQEAFAVEAVDTNGAGDVFAGAMIFASMQKWPPRRRLRFASAASALKCRKLGNRESLPSLHEIEEFLKERPDRAGLTD